MSNLYTKEAGSVNYDNLISGTKHPIDIKSVTLLAGQGVLTRGAVLGLITKAIGNPDAGANTGDGTVTGVSLASKSKLGTYTLECITAAANGGTFKVVDPDGVNLDEKAQVGGAYAGPINFTINDGATDFTVGDKFTIVVSEGSKKGKVVDSTNVDGSQGADCILTDDIDTTVGDVVTTAYRSGLFNRQALFFGGTDTAADHKTRLRELGIHLKDNLAY